jgi:ATP-dependent RNA helicase RhlE
LQHERKNAVKNQSAKQTKLLDSTGFSGLGLSADLCRTVKEAGYVEPTPIQTEAVPHVLAGRDLLGCAQTGTGKTAAFALPILHGIMRSGGNTRGANIRALVLAPTRELAAQIGASFAQYAGRGGPRQQVVFGGVNKSCQIRALRRGVHVLVATPGRLLDLMNDGVVKLSNVDTFVLDEADRMLDMGFIHDVQRVAKALPSTRQTLMFSATMPREIRALAERIMKSPVRVAVDPIASTREPTAQSVYLVEQSLKTALLVELLSRDDIDRALVFTRTKHGANKVVKKLIQAGFGAAAIHGNKSQSARERALADFKARRIRLVVATDIAARGLDIKDLSHVINYDLPNEPESYVHRIGRTGRAGASGIAVSFCSTEERDYLRDIERLTRRRIDYSPTPEGLSKKSSASLTKAVSRESLVSPRRRDGTKRRRPRRGRNRQTHPSTAKAG